MHDTGYEHSRYVAQATSNPLTPTSVYTLLAGTGRSRRLTGAPGTKQWVQFARVYRNVQSPWSAPVLVILPS